MVAETVTVTYTRAGKTFTASTTVSDPVVNPSLPSGVTLQQLDGGGLSYYAKFSPRFPADNFYPLAVWYQRADNQTVINQDKAAGLNTYVVLDSNGAPASNPALVRSSGMYAIAGPMTGRGSEMVGYQVDDEMDMSDPPGWYGAPTAGQIAKHKANIAALPKDGHPLHANYGKGIMFGADAAASSMINLVDIISDDEYWFTDSDLFGQNQGGNMFGLGRDMKPSEVRRASNYGATVRRMRKLANYAKPIWGFVELGGPWQYNTGLTGPDPFITAPQLRAAVWSCVIGGALGVIYFAHTFSQIGSTTGVQRESDTADGGMYKPINATLRSVNAQITSFAGVLNQPNAVGLVSANAAQVDVMAKWNNGSPVIFAGSKENANTNPQFTLVGGPWATATVDGENRSIPIVGGKFTDVFADGNAVHIYRIS